jgi:hypothetical protein
MSFVTIAAMSPALELSQFEISGVTMTSKIVCKLIPFMIGIVTTGLLAGCAAPNNADLPMAHLADMPAVVQEAPVVVQQAYQFAAANPAVLAEIPCYCGCEFLGHKSNYDCYFSGVDAQGKLTFDRHALGCAMCVNITKDTMGMVRAGHTTAEMREYVERTYAP